MILEGMSHGWEGEEGLALQQPVAKANRKCQPKCFSLVLKSNGFRRVRIDCLSEHLKCPKTMDFNSDLLLKLAWINGLGMTSAKRPSMSYVQQKSQSCRIVWFWNMIRKVPARFLCCVSFIRAIFLRDYSIDRCSNDKLKQQGDCLWKIHMHTIHKWFV